MLSCWLRSAGLGRIAGAALAALLVVVFTVVAGPTSAAIVDGPRGGDPDFMWLPPTVPDMPEFTGPFDGSLLDALAVEVCELSATGACVAGPPLERFTAFSQPVPARLTVDPAGESYTVDWQTGTSRVDRDRYYRVRVLNAGTELGSLDVDLVQNPPELSGVDRAKYVGVVRGQQLTIRFRVQQPSARTRVKINEVESSGGSPGDWVELFNTAPVPLSLAGYVIKDNDDSHVYTIPAGVTIPANGYFVVGEPDMLFGLGSADAVRFYAPGGAALIDSYSWTAHALTTYGRCPDGSGAFKTTTSVTKGAANDCSNPANAVKINEVESSGGVPGDWVELYNPSPVPADIGGLVFKDNDDTHAYTIPAGAVIPPAGYYLLDEAAFGFGLGSADSARLFGSSGAVIDSYSWTSHATTTYGRCPNGTGAFATTTSVTKGAANDCTSPATAVKINEVESSGGVPGDWVELYNPSAVPADISGMVFSDNDDAHAYTIPAGTLIPAGGYYLLEEGAFLFGLGSGDSARLFSAAGVLVDSHSWTAHASTTYGRCPNGTGAFTTTNAPTKGAANACNTAPGDTVLPWPGGSSVVTADASNVFGANLSGLVYEGSGSATPGVMWAVRNGPGSLFRLVWDAAGGIWTPDTANGWNTGKLLRYPDGTGNVDGEGVTYAGPGSAGGVYVASERNNDVSGVSKNAILRYDVSAAGGELVATAQWDITADLPVVGPNLGIEAITWVPDAFLVSHAFFDERMGHLYNPAEYPDHAGGLFLVGLEANGAVYAYALDHLAGSFSRVATINPGLAGVMDLQFDRELGDLWAVCDDTCSGRSATLRIDPATGRFVVAQRYERPASSANLNNEGFAFAPLAECSGGVRPVYWADDSATGGHSLRRGTLACP